MRNGNIPRGLVILRHLHSLDFFFFNKCLCIRDNVLLIFWEKHYFCNFQFYDAILPLAGMVSQRVAQPESSRAVSLIPVPALPVAGVSMLSLHCFMYYMRLGDRVLLNWPLCESVHPLMGRQGVYRFESFPLWNRLTVIMYCISSHGNGYYIFFLSFSLL